MNKVYELEEVFGGYRITKYLGIEKNVIIPSEIDGLKVVAIDNEAFECMQLKSIKISDSVEVIGDKAFNNNELENVKIPSSVTEIGEEAFWGNNLASVIIPDSVKTIGNEAFAYNKLENVKIGNSVEIIGARAFYGNNLTNIVIPDSVKTIGNRAFEYNNLKNVMIPDSVMEIGARAFDKKVNVEKANNNICDLRKLALENVYNDNTMNKFFKQMEDDLYGIMLKREKYKMLELGEFYRTAFLDYSKEKVEEFIDEFSEFGRSLGLDKWLSFNNYENLTQQDVDNFLYNIKGIRVDFKLKKEELIEKLKQDFKVTEENGKMIITKLNKIGGNK